MEFYLDATLLRPTRVFEVEAASLHQYACRNAITLEGGTESVTRAGSLV